MKKYLLLASTALLFSTNAMANATWDNDHTSNTLTMTATITPGISGIMLDMAFGSFVLKGEYASGDQLAEFNNGTLTVNDERVAYHNGESSGLIEISSGCGTISGITIANTSVDLKDDRDIVMAEVTNLRLHNTSSPGFCDTYFDGKLKLKNVDGWAQSDNWESSLSGTTTVTLDF